MPAGRHHLRPLFRGQRVDARLLRRRHRDRECEHRHGRAGDDRGRRPRRVRAGGGRPDERADSRTAWSTSRVADEAEAVRVAKKYLSYFQGRSRATEVGRSAPHAADHSREPPARVRRARGVETLADTGSVLELRREFARGMVTALIRVEGRPVGVDRQRPDAPRRRDRFATAPTRPRASCSCATRTTSRCCSCATRRASWSDRRSRRPRWCGTPAACS